MTQMNEQFLGTVFLLVGYTYTVYHGAEGSVHLPMDERLANYANQAS